MSGRTRSPLLGVLIAVLAANALFLNYNAFRVLYFLDAGSYLFASWRVFKGVFPYVDFTLKCGPIYFYFNALLFHIFGFGKMAVLAHLVIVSSAVIACSYAICVKHRLPFYAGTLVLCLTTVSFFWSFPFPLLTQLAHGLGILGIAWLILKLPFVDHRQAFWSGALCGFLAVISFMTKFNVGGAYALVYAAALLITGKRRFSYLGLFLGTLVGLLSVTIFFIRDTQAFTEQALSLIQFTYNQTGRVQQLGIDLKVWLSNYYVWIAGIVAPGLWRNLTAKKELAVLFFGLWFVGIFSTYTSTLVYEQDVEVTGIYVALAFALLHRLPDGILRKISALALSALSIFLICLYAKYGVEIKGWAFHDNVHTFAGEKINPVGDYAMKAPELRGWLAKSHKGIAVDELTEYIKANVAPDDSLLVLTDLQILYPLTDRDSYRLTPPFWGIPVAPAPGKEMEEFRKGFRKDPPLWIVTHKKTIAHLNDLISYLGLEEDIVSSYIITKESDYYIMLRRIR